MFIKIVGTSLAIISIIGGYYMLHKDKKNSLSHLIKKFAQNFINKTSTQIDFLTFKDIITWIREKGQQANENKVAFVLKEKTKDGIYSIVAGVFNKETEEVTDAVKYEATEIDQELKDQDDLVIYN